MPPWGDGPVIGGGPGHWGDFMKTRTTVATPATATTGAVNITVDSAGGFLYGTGTVTFKTGALSNGKVTGGTGAFKGVTGTIKAKNLNKQGTRTAVTITYS